jgi:hypothetical protein
VAKDLSGTTAKRTSAPVVSTTPVTPYADLVVQLQVQPDVPVDLQAVTLSGWQVVWQQLDRDGKTVLQTVRGFTNGFGKAGLTAGADTNWTVVVAPKNWDGFQPLPDATKGQSADANGRLTTVHLSGGSYRAPRQVMVAYQNEISIHGQASLDLTGDKQQQLAGAGLSGLLVYNDLNNNGQWDPGEPRTATDLGGFYDLRFPLPDNQLVNNYLIRLTPDPSAVATNIRTHPDSTTDFTFASGAAYAVSVDTSQPNPRELFDHRDFLIQKQFLISGVAYVSGHGGQDSSPGATPVAGATVTLFDEAGNKLGDTTTGPDGSYQFLLPGRGRYVVTAGQPGQVDVPDRQVFRVDASQPQLSIALTTPQGAPLDHLPGNSGGAVASGDFFGDGKLSFATLGINPPLHNVNGTEESDLYLTIVKGADSRGQITAQSALILPNANFNSSHNIPSIFWSEGLKLFVLPIPFLSFGDNGPIARTYDPATGQVHTVPFPANATGMNLLMGVSSSAEAKADTWLLSDAFSDVTNGSNWMLVRYTDYAREPEVIASFHFSTSNGVRPSFIGGSSQATRWTALTQGDLDGDGIDDYAFDAVDAKGQSVIAYLLSREHFSRVQTLRLGGLPSDPRGGEPNYFVQSLQLVPVSNDPTSPPWLAVHRLAFAASDDLILFSTHPATLAQVAAGAAATSLAFESVFDLRPTWADGFGFPSSDYLADMNGDGLQDLVVVPQINEGLTGLQAIVLLNQGNGQFTKQPLVTVPISPPGAQFRGVGGLLSTGPGTPPSFLGIADGNSSRLDSDVVLGTNASSLSHSYVAEVNSPGSYGGYNFGFVSGTPVDGETLSGTAYIDRNGNGQQDPGEPNLVNQRVQVTFVDNRGSVTTQVVQTDAAGRYRVTGGGRIILNVQGLSPRNTEPAPSPPPLLFPLNAAAFLPSPVVGGQGIAVGGANLVQTLDYGDSFTLGTGTRTGLAPNGRPAGDQLNVEYHNPLAPERAWSTLGQISTDAAATDVPGLAYPGRSNAGSESGFVQAPGNTLVGIPYGLRDQYVVEADFVQTRGGVVVSSGAQPGEVDGSSSLTVTFFADGSSAGVTLSNQAGTVTVYDSADGNQDSQGQARPLQAGTKVDTWNNYAVAFDRINQRLTLYVNNRLLKTLDLTVFAGDRFAAFANAALTVGANDRQRVWLDNFQVGAPYVGYQTSGTPGNQTGYDFGVKDATTNSGALQGTVVVYNANDPNPFSPNHQPLAGVTVFLDVNGDGVPGPGEPQTTTDAHGNYRFTGLKPGNYVVRQDLPPNRVIAVQGPDGKVSYGKSSITVDVLGGQTAYANNFSDKNTGLLADYTSDSHQDHVAHHLAFVYEKRRALGLAAPQAL